MKQIYSVLVQDTPGSLNRIVNQFRKRNINIESLAVGPCEKQGISRVTIVAKDIKPDRRDFFAQSLNNLVDVIEVENVSDRSHIVRENVLVKMDPPPKKSKDLGQLAHRHHARILQNGCSSLVVEAIGSPKEMDQLVEDLKPFNVLKLVRSASLAISRQGEKEPSSQTISKRSQDLTWVTQQLNDYLS